MPAAPRKGNVLDQSLVGTKTVVMAKPNSARIVEVFQQATEDERRDGINWYREAHSIASKLDPANVERAAGIIAALSPMMPWDRNIHLAHRTYLDGSASGALGANVVKANRIFNGEAPLDVLSGDKVRNFFQCIAEPSSDAVCIDRHAFDIAVGKVTNNDSRAQLGRKGVYETFAKAYVRAARTLSKLYGTHISPSEVQAVTWVVWRRLKGL